jgi:hypothetical protein
VNSRRPRPRPTLCPRAASVAEFLVPDAQHCCFLSLTPWRAITGPQQDISRGKRGRWSSGETALAAECGLDNHVNICNLRPSAHATRTLTRCKTMWLRQARVEGWGGCSSRRCSVEIWPPSLDESAHNRLHGTDVPAIAFLVWLCTRSCTT